MFDDWDDWVFRESTIRTASIYFLLTVVASMEFGLACDDPEDWSLNDMPLPASKALWEARDRAAWEKAVASNGASTSVIEFHHLALMDNEDLRSKIEMWQEGADELGLLTSMASILKS